MIAITFALRAESSDFLRLVRDKNRRNHHDVTSISGRIDNHAIEVLHTGVGEKVCRKRLASFLQDGQFDCLISTGFAGALADDFHVGDLFVARNFSTLEVTSPLRLADLYTVPALIDSAEERKKIAQTTGAAAVDMETKFIARACAENGLPMLSLRVISDTPAQPFPAPSEILFDIARQRTDHMKFAAFFVKHPSRVPRLIHFARRIGHARKTLAHGLVEVLRAMAF